ncbi:MAG: VOC family protein [Gemmatimonadales bacterium]
MNGSASRRPILGLHHVTATVADAQDDLDFAVATLGLRLVKKTVNFDNHNVYHFYYGNELGSPGTIWTTFPYKGRGVPAGRKGEGQIGITSFSVPAGSLGFWRKRLGARGIAAGDAPPRFGDEIISFADPSGLSFELIAGNGDSRTPWTGGGVPVTAAIRGLHGVTMVVGTPERTVELMTGMLGFEIVDETEKRLRLAVNGNEPGRFIEIVYGTGEGEARNGLGTVHHVAMAIGSGEQQRELREELLAGGTRVTDVLDRQYFQSIYFREPGGVLFEVATVEPGFSVDESPGLLGRDLKLPPWEEPNRTAIEAGLPGVEVPP